MPTAEAHVATDRAGRYLDQLCSHLNHMGRMRQRSTGHDGGDHGEGPARPTVERVDHSDTDGSIRFTGGLCTLRATADTLTLRVDADDEDILQRLQNGLTTRLEKIGRRDELTVIWHRSETVPAPDGQTINAETAVAKPWWRRGWRSTIGLGAFAVLVIVGHAGLFGGVMAASVFQKWGLGVVVALIVVKVLIGGMHVLGGGFALRRGRTLLPSRWRMRHLPRPRRTRGHSRPSHTPANPTSSSDSDRAVAATNHPERA